MDLAALRHELKVLADPAVAIHLQRYFRTGPGQYGEGDRFLGIRVPQLRALVRRSRGITPAEVLELLRSAWHEERFLALLLLVDRYRRGRRQERDDIFRTYLANIAYVNNWDLVDASAEHIVGAHVPPSELDVLERLARSGSVWQRRIAVMATFHWTKRGELGPALHVAGLLVGDRHDLIHKAVGWMLREVGKRDRSAEEAFLRVHYHQMPRTMLRYSIEHFEPQLRQAYLRGEV
jgi:3-methyladenine DNA glycosylase AlkD